MSFGDSLPDVGTYSPATSLTGNGQPLYFGGKFTANSTTGKATGATVIETTIDFRPWTYAFGLSYRF